MSKKLYTPFRIKAKHLRKEGYRWVVYKREYDRIQSTYYHTKKEAEQNRDWISC